MTITPSADIIAGTGVAGAPKGVAQTYTPFGITIWGWGATLLTKQVSYAYPAGASFQLLNKAMALLPSGGRSTR